MTYEEIDQINITHSQLWEQLVKAKIIESHGVSDLESFRLVAQHMPDYIIADIINLRDPVMEEYFRAVNDEFIERELLNGKQLSIKEAL